MKSSAMLTGTAVNAVSEIEKHGISKGGKKAMIETEGALGALRAAKKKSSKSSGASARGGSGKISNGGRSSGGGKSSGGKKRKLKGNKSYRKKVTDRKYIREE